MAIHGNHALAWIPNPRVNPTVVSHLGDEMFAIANRLESLTTHWTDSNALSIFRTEVRGISVSLRKLLGESMLRSRVKGLRLHTLTPVSDSEGCVLLSIPPYTISRRTTPDSVPIWETRVEDDGMELHSVPGFRHFNIAEFRVDGDIFDVSVAPSKKVDQWLKQPMLQIGRGEGRVFTLGDVLSYVVHTEGAHWDDYTTARHPDSKTFLAEALEFMQTPDSVHYPHFVTAFVGMYLRNLWGNSLHVNGDAWSRAKGNYASDFPKYPRAEHDMAMGGVVGFNLRGPFTDLGISLDNLETQTPPYQHFEKFVFKSAV